jgi:uncharacterized membrane protein
MKTRFFEKQTGQNRETRASLKSGEGLKLEECITINRSPSELYTFWRRLENLPRFMKHLESVTEDTGGGSHWVMKASPGNELEWDAQIIEEKPGEMISWQSLEGAELANAGSVWFTPAQDGRGTELKVSMKYSPPGGKLAATFAKLVGVSAEHKLREDLLNLKEMLERSDTLESTDVPS